MWLSLRDTFFWQCLIAIFLRNNSVCDLCVFIRNGLLSVWNCSLVLSMEIISNYMEMCIVHLWSVSWSTEIQVPLYRCNYNNLSINVIIRSILKILKSLHFDDILRISIWMSRKWILASWTTIWNRICNFLNLKQTINKGHLFQINNTRDLQTINILPSSH